MRVQGCRPEGWACLCCLCCAGWLPERVGSCTGAQQGLKARALQHQCTSEEWGAICGSTHAYHLCDAASTMMDIAESLSKQCCAGFSCQGAGLQKGKRKAAGSQHTQIGLEWLGLPFSPNPNLHGCHREVLPCKGGAAWQPL